MAMTHGAGAPRRERDWRRVLAASGLPSEARGLIERVVQRARLWPRERADVCRELVSHFQGGLERGATTAELIRDFGDPALASKMIGRGKRRARPLVWHALVRTGQAVGALVLALAGAYLYFAASLWLHAPKITHNYALELDAEALAVPADERAWPVMEAAGVIIGTPVGLGDRKEQILLFHDLYTVPAQTWRRERMEAAMELCRYEIQSLYRLQDYDAIGYLLSAGPASTNSLDIDWPRYGGSTPLVLLPATDWFFVDQTISVLLSDAHIATGANESFRVEQGLLTALHTARMFGSEQRAGQAFLAPETLNSVLELVRESLLSNPRLFSNAALHRLMAELADESGFGLDDGHGARIVLNNLLQRVFVDSGSSDGWFDLRALRGQPELVFEEQMKWLDWMNPALAAATVAPRSAQVRKFESIRNWQEHRELEADPVERVRYWPVVRCGPIIDDTNSQEVRFMRRDATLVAIALESKRRDTGAWATSIDDLFPEYLQRMPVDIYDRQTLRLRVIDGQPVVYSVGMDLDDDGGRPAVENGEPVRSMPYAGPLLHPPGVMLHDGDLILFPIRASRTWSW